MGRRRRCHRALDRAARSQRSRRRRGGGRSPQPGSITSSSRTPTSRSPHGLVEIARQATSTFVPDRRRDGTNVMSFPDGIADLGPIRPRLVPPPPGVGTHTDDRGPVRPSPVDRPRHTRPTSPIHCSERYFRHGCQRSRSTTSPIDVRDRMVAQPADAVVGAGDRGTPRRRRVRVRRSARQVGSRRMCRPPPRVHRRLEGHLGRRRRRRRARSSTPGRAA